jgi:hypothetical protein
MGKSKIPIGALRDSGELKHILRFKRDTKLYVAPVWEYEYSGQEMILLKLEKFTFFKRNILHQVKGSFLPSKVNIYFNRLVTGNFPFRIIETGSNGPWYYLMKDDRAHFLFTNYFHAYGYMLRSNHEYKSEPAFHT